MSVVVETAEKARRAAQEMASISTDAKNKALQAMAVALRDDRSLILKENEKDLEGARASGTSKAMMDRLTLSEERIEDICQGIETIADLPDPVGEIISGRKMPNGLEIQQVRTPLGVIAMVYEARPNVTPDAAALTLKAGNAVILRGGSEALHSNRVLVQILSRAAEKAGLPQNTIQMLPVQEHEAVKEMLSLSHLIDLVIPRGGENLIRSVAENSRIPVIKHFKGICHVYIDRMADPKKAVDIAHNAKAQRPSTCNAAETLLVHQEALSFLPQVLEKLDSSGVEIRGDQMVREVFPGAKEATEEDWATEYLDLVMSVKVVSSLDEAISHIRSYSSGLAESIVTEDYSAGRRFLAEVDSAAVFLNASTRFTDGGQFGLGAEIGITTDRIFPRGPMGLRELTSSKYVIYGSGQIRG